MIEGFLVSIRGLSNRVSRISNRPLAPAPQFCFSRLQIPQNKLNSIFPKEFLIEEISPLYIMRYCRKHRFDLDIY